MARRHGVLGLAFAAGALAILGAADAVAMVAAAAFGGLATGLLKERLAARPRAVPRPRRAVGEDVYRLALLLGFRYSASRDALVLRGVGHAWGPVLRRRTKAAGVTPTRRTRTARPTSAAKLRTAVQPTTAVALAAPPGPTSPAESQAAVRATAASPLAAAPGPTSPAESQAAVRATAASPLAAPPRPTSPARPQAAVRVTAATEPEPAPTPTCAAEPGAAAGPTSAAGPVVAPPAASSAPGAAHGRGARLVDLVALPVPSPRHGRIWQLTAVDVHARFTWAELCRPRGVEPSSTQVRAFVRRIGAQLDQRGLRLDAIVVQAGTAHRRLLMAAVDREHVKVLRALPGARRHPIAAERHREIAGAHWNRLPEASHAPPLEQLDRQLQRWVARDNGVTVRTLRDVSRRRRVAERARR